MDGLTKSKWFVDELLKDYPDVDNHVRYSFSDEFIRLLPWEPSEHLSIIMIALSRFLSHVQFFGNQLNAETAKLKRKFESLKYLAIANTEGITDRTTSNVMMAKIYKTNPEIPKLEAQLMEVEEKAKYYERLPDRLNEHIQIIKYELRRREGGK
jgi:hypothetical protein